MSNNSAPVFEEAPTFDEVVEYAVNNGLFGKISLTKFYDYYGDFRGKGGLIIDWKAKLRMWADNQRSAVVVTAKEAEAKARVKKANDQYIDSDAINALNEQMREYNEKNNHVIDDLLARVAMI